MVNDGDTGGKDTLVSCGMLWIALVWIPICSSAFVDVESRWQCGKSISLRGL
jgi:hypothetical protein